MTIRFLLYFIIAAVWLSLADRLSVAGEANPPLLVERGLPAPETTAQPAATSRKPSSRGWGWPKRKKRATDGMTAQPAIKQPSSAPRAPEADQAQLPAVQTDTPSPSEAPDALAEAEAEDVATEPQAIYDTADAMGWRRELEPPPTPEAVAAYQRKLESRLLERYNNLPEYGGMVGAVTVVLSRPLDVSLDGGMIRAEFDQLVYDRWGKRLPELEKEYYVVTFGAGGVQQVRSDPSIRVGLDLEKTYSERAPLAADPFRHVEPADTFRSAPETAMPEWWRPNY